MRLTLRTLLAYLDDVLDPVDKEELAKKIQSSEFAEDLVHRTRDTVRRLRLSAPQVVGTGMGLDPNTVAEYLDNVMPPEQVGDFERICLESDVHLAEAAACHHVLTMILGEPADVDPLAKQRMFSIATEAADRKRIRIEPAHTGPAAATPTAAGLAPAPSPLPELPSSLRPRAVEVPDYLRAGSWWRSTGAVIGLAVIVLIGISFLFASGLRGWISNKSAIAPLTAENAQPAQDSAAAVPPRIESPPMEPADNTAVAKNDSTLPKPLSSPPQPMTPGLAPIATTTAPPAPAASDDRYAVTTNPPAAVPQTNSTDAAAGSSLPGTVEPSGPAASTPPTTLPLPPAHNPAIASLPQNETAMPTTPPGSAAAPPLSPPTSANDSLSPPADKLAISNPVPPPAEPAATLPATGDIATAAKPPTSTAPPDCGTYMGGETVLLRYDDKAAGWFRVDPRAAVVPGERVLALPEFRPKIALVSGVQLDLSGGTQAVMGGGEGNASAKQADADFIPTIELVYGRAVLINPTNGEKQIRLKLGPATGVAKLARNATLAAEVERKHVAGLDPRQTAAPVEIRLFAPDGGVVWQDAAGEKTAEKASRWTLTDSGASDLSPDPAPPEWIDHEPIILPSEQRYGAPVIKNTLASNAPAETQLLELFQGSSRKEVKSLVARSSIYVGVYQPFVDALRDSEQKASWKTHIDTLRTAMSLNPESANKVYQALVDQRGKPAAADLYEMLCGYNADQIGHTPDQMKTGAVAKLINWLEDDSLDYRVLAVQDLWEITGKRLMLNPAAKLPERTQNVKRWRSQLESGDLKVIAPAG